MWSDGFYTSRVTDIPALRKHGETISHPFEPERIILLRFRRGPDDPKWEARFRLTAICGVRRLLWLNYRIF
jgi:hypothetical protein